MRRPAWWTWYLREDAYQAAKRHGVCRNRYDWYRLGRVSERLARSLGMDPVDSMDRLTDSLRPSDVGLGDLGRRCNGEDLRR